LVGGASATARSVGQILPQVSYTWPKGVLASAHVGSKTTLVISVKNVGAKPIDQLWLGLDLLDEKRKTVENTRTERASRETGKLGRIMFAYQGEQLKPGEGRTFETVYTFDKDIWGNPYKPGKYILKYAAWEGNPGDGIMLSEMQTHEFQLKPSPTAARIRKLIEDIEKKEEEATPRLAEEGRLRKLKEQEEQELQRQIAEALIKKNQASEEKAKWEIERSVAQMTNRLFALLKEKERIASESFRTTSLSVSIWTVPRSLSVWKAGLLGKGLTIYYCCNQNADVEIWSAVDVSSRSALGRREPSRMTLLSRRVQADRTYQFRTRIPSELIELVWRMERARKSVNMSLPKIRGKAQYFIKARAGGKEASNSTYVTLTE